MLPKRSRCPAFLGVVDREHLDGVNPRLKLAPHEHLKITDDQDFVAIDKVRYDGDLVALVVAEDRRTAERALEKIHVDYEPLPPVFDAVEALAPGAPLVHDERGSNLLLEDSLSWGDIDEGFRQADRVFEETFSSPSMFHHPMEPIGGFLAQCVNGEANIWLPTSSPTARCGGLRALSRRRTGQGASTRALRRRRFRIEDSHDGPFRGVVTLAQDRPSGALDTVSGR